MECRLSYLYLPIKKHTPRPEKRHLTQCTFPPATSCERSELSIEKLDITIDDGTPLVVTLYGGNPNAMPGIDGMTHSVKNDKAIYK